MSKFEEFVSVNKRIEVKVDHENNRQHIRISLRNRTDSNLALACDGKTVTLCRRGWWKNQKLGIANIKDIGMGGIGLITSVPLKLNQTIEIQLQNLRLSIMITRSSPINNKLHFYGARWLEADDKVLAMINNTHPTDFKASNKALKNY
ncbi:hypothetical protein HWQ46_10335 [Shewanella sp. D64]|uniref:hypothetical protein n=1 Tax=unclassified Shewanella TaxID=196818 RepID=UPI0022BA280E|nr:MULTISPECIES: hypothetical protein [unclassified Shewanella]MEC4725943.1 hypothetical protein [Shewanella sp. D64]MEC4737198.1 hypothetical protein [Shewanella sp. E94]WBJ95610.1 hypothetical protein HWQ47_00300 [Shewanella sp. MTB7]